MQCGALDTYVYSEPAVEGRLAQVMTCPDIPRREHCLVEIGIVRYRVVDWSCISRLLGSRLEVQSDWTYSHYYQLCCTGKHWAIVDN